MGGQPGVVSAGADHRAGGLDGAQVLLTRGAVFIGDRVAVVDHHFVGDGLAGRECVFLDREQPAVVGEQRQVFGHVVVANQPERHQAGAPADELGAADMIDDRLHEGVHGLFPRPQQAEAEPFAVKPIGGLCVRLVVDAVVAEAPAPPAVGLARHQHVGRVHRVDLAIGQFDLDLVRVPAGAVPPGGVPAVPDFPRLRIRVHGPDLAVEEQREHASERRHQATQHVLQARQHALVGLAH